MKRFILSFIFLLTISLPVNALDEGKLSCMYTRWCRNNVNVIKNINDIKAEFPEDNYDNITDEFNKLINNLKRFRVKVYLADKKYFPEKIIGIITLETTIFI